ncbi:MAG: dipeptide ABC transporter ATP-binding protein [Pseudonocardiaceae bacterium]|nr:dipeptide ABC transporter ATP-binding protein [Pseudonocardiaceae bacterium]
MSAEPTSVITGDANEAPPAVEIRDLVVSYRRRRRNLQVLRGVSLAIQPGEAYGLVGESGCGKTTVAMTLMRYLPPNAVIDDGSVSLEGEDMLGMSPAQLRELRGNRLAMVYQETASSLNPTLRIGEQIAEVYRYHRAMGRAEAADAAREMLTRVQLADPGRVARRYPHEMSGGQKQRVVIAMALATNPHVLVLDEPTTGLDTTVEAEVLELVAGLRSDYGTSVLFISHNLGIVAQMCERVGVLYAGRLVEEGAAQHVLTEPKHPYTLALLRCVPRMGMHKDTMRLDPIPGSLPALGTDVPACVFADRCSITEDRCHTQAPPLVPVASGHTSRCHFVDAVSKIPPRAFPSPADKSDDASEPLLLVEDARKTYSAPGQHVEAVAGVSLEVHRGEILGVVGESGSGKSTLARCVVGLDNSSAGTLSFGGISISPAARRRRHALRRAVQMVFQDPDTSLNPRRSVRRLLLRSVRLLRGERGRTADLRVRQLLADVRLEPRHLEVKPAALSGGLKQRVAIASAFAGEPELVVCDEPVSSLDVSVQAAILNLLSDLHVDRQLSYILISHDLGVVRYLSDRIAVMYLGEIVEVGSAEEMFKPGHHPYTEALVSAIPSLNPTEPGRGRIRLTGTIPSPANPPSGCRFHTRCPRAIGDLCRTEKPPWQHDGDGHTYRCHIPPTELRALQTHDDPPMTS